MASPIAIVGSRISHLRLSAMRAYSLIRLCRNSTLMFGCSSCTTNFSLSPRLLLPSCANHQIDKLRFVVHLFTSSPEFSVLRPLRGSWSSRSDAKRFRSRGARRLCRLSPPEPCQDESDTSASASYCFGAQLLRQPTRPSSVAPRPPRTNLSCSRPSRAYRRSSALRDSIAPRSAPGAPLRPDCPCHKRRRATPDCWPRKSRWYPGRGPCDSCQRPRLCSGG